MQEGDVIQMVMGGNGNNGESKRGRSETHLGDSRCGNKLTGYTSSRHGKRDTGEFQGRVNYTWQSLPSNSCWFRVQSWRCSTFKISTGNWINRARLVLALKPLSYGGAFPAWCIDLLVTEVAHPAWHTQCSWRSLGSICPSSHTLRYIESHLSYSAAHGWGPDLLSQKVALGELQ